MIIAPSMSRTQQTAVSGTMNGAMRSTAGRTRPAAARSSRTPMALTKPALACPVHSAPLIADSFFFGTSVLVTPPVRETAASTPAAIHRARFMRFVPASGR